MKNSITFLFTFVIVLCFLFSCFQKNDEYTLDLVPTPVLQTKPQWALVVSPFARLYADTKEDSLVVDTIWHCSIFRILSQTPFPDEDGYHWYQMNYYEQQLWVDGRHLELFYTENEAKEALKLYDY